MERKVAEEIILQNLQILSQLNLLMVKVEQITPEEELRAMRKNIGNVLAAIDLNLFVPILKQYPDLDPHKD